MRLCCEGKLDDYPQGRLESDWCQQVRLNNGWQLYCYKTLLFFHVARHLGCKLQVALLNVGSWLLARMLYFCEKDMALWRSPFSMVSSPIQCSVSLLFWPLNLTSKYSSISNWSLRKPAIWIISIVPDDDDTAEESILILRTKWVDSQYACSFWWCERAGAPLVPIYSFGQNKAYKFIKFGPPLVPYKLYRKIVSTLKFCPMLIWGLYGSPLPFRWVIILFLCFAWEHWFLAQWADGGSSSLTAQIKICLAWWFAIDRDSNTLKCREDSSVAHYLS